MYRYPAETTIAEQANAMRKLNPEQQQWAYYAIDLVATELTSTRVGPCTNIYIIYELHTIILLG